MKIKKNSIIKFTYSWLGPESYVGCVIGVKSNAWEGESEELKADVIWNNADETSEFMEGLSTNEVVLMTDIFTL